MTVIAQPINKRPYMIMYYDCFESEIFDNQSQRTVYMTLKKFADANNQCFPALKKIASVALLSKRAVQKALKELQNKLLVTIENRFRKDGSQTSNLYTIHDVTELQITGNAKNAKDVENTGNVKNTENTENAKNEIDTAKIIEQCEDEQLASVLKARGYRVSKDDDVVAIPQDKFVLNSASETVSDNNIMAQNESTEENKITEIEKKAEDVVVQENESVLNNTMPEKENSTIGNKIMSKLKNITKKEKEPTSTPTKAKDVSTNKNSISNDNSTILSSESQSLEEYSLDWIKEHFGYDTMIDKYPDYHDKIDSVFDIIYTNINATNKKTRIHGDEKPPMVIKSKFLKLDSEDIIYAIGKFVEQIQTVKIKNHTGYLTTLLFNAHEQRCFDTENTKQYDKVQKNGQAPESNETQSTATTLPLSRDIYPRNQFHQFMERKTTPEELNKLERALLGNLRFTTDDISTEQD